MPTASDEFAESLKPQRHTNIDKTQGQYKPDLHGSITIGSKCTSTPVANGGGMEMEATGLPLFANITLIFTAVCCDKNRQSRESMKGLLTKQPQ